MPAGYTRVLVSSGLRLLQDFEGSVDFQQATYRVYTRMFSVRLSLKGTSPSRTASDIAHVILHQCAPQYTAAFSTAASQCGNKALNTPHHTTGARTRDRAFNGSRTSCSTAVSDPSNYSRRFATVTARTAWESSKTAVMLQERVKVGTSIEHSPRSHPPQRGRT